MSIERASHDTPRSTERADAAGPTPRRQPGPFRRWAEALVVAFLVVTFVVTTVGIEGRSMEPTLRSGERALVPRYETWAARVGVHRWRAGDVVYFRAPGDEPRNLVERVMGGPFVIKRIVAIAGQTVALEHGRLLVDGTPSDVFPGAAPIGGLSATTTLVPSDHVYVLGDNRTPLASRDSRAFGAVPTAAISGRAAWVIWPPLRATPDGGWAWNVRRVPRSRPRGRGSVPNRRPSATALAAAIEAQGARASPHRLEHERHVVP